MHLQTKQHSQRSSRSQQPLRVSSLPKIFVTQVSGGDTLHVRVNHSCCSWRLRDTLGSGLPPCEHTQFVAKLHQPKIR